MKKIKWLDIYYPAGKWVDEQGSKVSISKDAFRAAYNGASIIVVMVSHEGGGGHGEPRFSAKLPMFLTEKSLCTLTINDEFIEVEI